MLEVWTGTVVAEAYKLKSAKAAKTATRHPRAAAGYTSIPQILLQNTSTYLTRLAGKDISDKTCTFVFEMTWPGLQRN